MRNLTEINETISLPKKIPSIQLDLSMINLIKFDDGNEL